MNKVFIIMLALMGCMAIFMYSFGIPWSHNFFEDFGVASEELSTYTAPIVYIGNTMRQAYEKSKEVVTGFLKFKNDISLWTGDISYWAVAVCGLKSPYDMTPDECLGIFREFDNFVTENFKDDTERRAFIYECGKYVRFGIDRNGNIIPLYTGAPGTFNWFMLGKGPNYTDKIYTYIGNYNFIDCARVYGNYINSLGSIGTTGSQCFGHIDVDSQHRVYVWANARTVDYCKNLYPELGTKAFMDESLPLREIIPFSYDAFMQRVGTTPPDSEIYSAWVSFDDAPFEYY